MWSVVWDCLWFWQLKDPLGLTKKSRALCPSPEFLPWPDIGINVCERVIKPNSINQWTWVSKKVYLYRCCWLLRLVIILINAKAQGC